MSGSRRPPGERPESEPAPTRAAAAGAPPEQGRALVLATRGSDLALAQTRLVGDALAAAHSGIGWRLLTIATRGDRSTAAAPGGLPPAAGSASGGGDAIPGPVTARGERLGRAGGDAGELTEAVGAAHADGNGDAGSGSVARRIAAADAGSELAALARLSPGLFTSEVAAAVARGDASAAVHSLKDLPLDQRDGLCLAAILPRASAADVLVVAPGWVDSAAPLGLRNAATVGTSSPRRAALLRHFAPQARVVEVRGNVPTRLRRCSEGAVAAVVLAQAGLQRLGASLAGLRVLPLPPEHWQPAPGQGALAVQARRHDRALHLLAALDHAPTRIAVGLERSVLRALGGGCAAPCGAYASLADSGEWQLHYGLAGDNGRWHGYRLRDSAAGCRRALEAWAVGGPPPGEELPAEAAQADLRAVLFGAT